MSKSYRTRSLCTSILNRIIRIHYASHSPLISRRKLIRLFSIIPKFCQSLRLLQSDRLTIYWQIMSETEQKYKNWWLDCPFCGAGTQWTNISAFQTSFFLLKPRQTGGHVMVFLLASCWCPPSCPVTVDLKLDRCHMIQKTKKSAEIHPRWWVTAINWNTKQRRRRFSSFFNHLTEQKCKIQTK